MESVLKFVNAFNIVCIALIYVKPPLRYVANPVCVSELVWCGVCMEVGCHLAKVRWLLPLWVLRDNSSCWAWYKPPCRLSRPCSVVSHLNLASRACLGPLHLIGG